MSHKGRVCGHYVMVMPDKVETVSKGGIILESDVSEDRKRREQAATTSGTVVDVGPMAWRAYDGNEPDWEPWAKPGDRVYFVKHVSKVVEFDDVLDEQGQPIKFFVMADENIIFNLDGE